eukprot:13899353-Alexandrium_andersonii.AAC.1
MPSHEAASMVQWPLRTSPPPTPDSDSQGCTDVLHAHRRERTISQDSGQLGPQLSAAECSASALLR